MDKELKLLEDLRFLRYPFLVEEDNIGIFLVPGQARLHLQQWLLDVYEPGILSSPDIDLPNLNVYQKLELAYEQLGIFFDSGEAIRGNTGHESSLNVLVSLVALVKATFVGPDEANKLISFISRNIDSICSTQVQIFPPTFPPKYGELNTDLDTTIQYWKKELAHLKSQLNMYSSDLDMNYADKNTILILQKKISEFISATLSFRDVYEKGMQRQLDGKDREEPPMIGLGKQAHVAVTAYEQIAQMLQDIESIWSYLQTFQNL